MGREIRRVLKNWKHPKNNNGNYVPLFLDYIGSLKYFKEEVNDFIKHMTEIIKDGETVIYDRHFDEPQDVYEYLMEDKIIPPNIAHYMPEGEWYQLFENTSEGTPLSPPFEKKEELIKWLIENKDYCGTQWSKEGAHHIVCSGWVPSMAISNNRIYKAEETHLLINNKGVNND